MLTVLSSVKSLNVVRLLLELRNSLIDIPYMKHSSQQGFTLIELMMVVAILGILAAISMSQYRNYVTRSQVTRVMEETATLKASVETCLLDGRDASNCFINWSVSNLIGADATVSDPGQDGMTISYPDASIEARFGNAASIMIKGQTLKWTRSEAGSWSCLTTVAQRFTPNGCVSSDDA